MAYLLRNQSSLCIKSLIDSIGLQEDGENSEESKKDRFLPGKSDSRVRVVGADALCPCSTPSRAEHKTPELLLSERTSEFFSAMVEWKKE
jgi:hypothetical protein